MNNDNNKKLFDNIEKAVFIPALIVTVFIVVALIFFKDESHYVINLLYSFCTNDMGWAYYVTCIACFGFLIWVTVSPIGDLTLGQTDGGPQYGNFSWFAMLFTAGVGTSLVILGFLEPIYYVSDPPLHMEAYTIEAYEYAHMYGQFHWGLSAWAFYVPVTVAVGYTIFIKKSDRVSLSSSVSEGLERVKGKKIIGHIIDVFVVFGIIASITTSLGIGTPVVSKLLMYVFSVPENYSFIVNIIVLIVWVSIFGASVFLGLDKGIKRLSDGNIILTIIFMVFVFLCSDVVSSLKMEVNSLGLYAQEFIRINTWMDPFGDGEFISNWTVFYWGWWIAFMPMMGIFIAKISRGRKIKHVAWGQLLLGSAGSAVTFMIFGGYSLQLQQSGAVDLAAKINEGGNALAIIALIETLPFTKITMFCLCVVCFVYLATTIDSCAFVIAMVTTRKIKFNEEPVRWNRMLWAILFSMVSVGILIIDEFKAVQSVSIIAGLPLIPVTFLIIYSCSRISKKDFKNKGSD